MDDPRIPVVVGAAADLGPDDLAVQAPGQPGLQHLRGCACCSPRDALAGLLSSLYMAAARGFIPPFRRVLVTGATAAATEAAIEGDVLARARFRFAGPA